MQIFEFGPGGGGMGMNSGAKIWGTLSVVQLNLITESKTTSFSMFAVPLPHKILLIFSGSISKFPRL